MRGDGCGFEVLAKGDLLVFGRDFQTKMPMYTAMLTSSFSTD